MSFASLDGDVECDVCVIGAGISGLTTAYLLACAGRSVLAIDDGPVGSGETGRTTAHLASALDDRYRELERVRSLEASRLAAESHAAAIDRIESIARDEAIACGFLRVDGYLFLPPGRDIADLDRELEAATRAGLSVERLPRAPLASFDTGPCIRFPRQAQIQPLEYLAGLAHAFVARGGRLCTGIRATAVEGGRKARVATERGCAVTAGAVVVATNVPFHERFAIHTKQAAYTTYVVGARVARGEVPSALYWDDDQPYHYVRVAEAGDHDLLLVGGEDHRSGQDSEAAGVRHARLETWMRERFPTAGPVSYRWSGQVMETLDGLAYIGRDAGGEENVYVATGDSGMGLTHGTIAGILLTDLVRGIPHPWAELYEPSRAPLAAGGRFASENLRTLERYCDWLTPGDAADAADVPLGEGALVRRGLTKLAVHRDEEGSLHAFSAVCPHLGCLVRWNPDAKGWDCPCHGSRFDALGHVITGPANKDLAVANGDVKP